MTAHFTIGQLARRRGLSRSTLLYYDRLGLLQPVDRTEGNYRLYSQAQAERLERICLYRGMGMPLKTIGLLLDQLGPNSPRAAQVLQGHLTALETEIERLKKQQRQILDLLKSMHQEPKLPVRSKRSRKVRGAPSRDSSKLLKKEVEMVNKDQFVRILTAAGLSEEDMRNIHRQFEKMEPQAHQEFLEALGIGSEEIKEIRAASA